MFITLILIYKVRISKLEVRILIYQVRILS